MVGCFALLTAIYTSNRSPYLVRLNPVCDGPQGIARAS